MDLVSEVLRLTGMRGTVGAQIVAGGEWTAELSDYPGIATHAVLSGGAWLVLGEGRQVQLATGDVVMVPAGTPHLLTDTPGTGPATAVPPSGDGGQVLRLGSGPSRTRIFTIHYDCNHATRTQVLDEMPDFIHVEGGESGAAYLADVVRLLGRELSRPQIGTDAVVDNLVDLVLIQLIRAWLSRRPAQQRGTWLGWGEDDVVREAVELVHADPARDWTTTSLAAAISVSRATLARRFQTAMGQSPANYITQWRMDLAAVRLRDTPDTIDVVATRAGYRSVPSFTRAFVRDRGRTPGAFRLQARQNALVRAP
ncbi:AraC family transcriptional regulator [Winogradskya humida]|uniref:HTH araC/xylS-type domain-containing protein n=1 Tax=Winogradskya humida TaxID=113566 RepID=A0ABQ4A177_9ACTN|nr:AraC family transcriptional regulator [Actinoplanes humidus]GIE24606.1 hypothetical protein Ahu01nite_077080 [Actinoplanes humidus]